MTGSDLVFRVVTDHETFMALGPSWDDLFARQTKPLQEQCFAWARAAWECLGQPAGRKLHVIVGERLGRTVLILPLTVQTLGPIRIAHWLGPGFFESCDVHLDPSVTDDELASALRLATASCHLLRLQVIQAESRLWPWFAKVRLSRSEETRAPYVDCRRWPTWQAYGESRSRSFRDDCKKSLRRLERTGRPRYAIVDQPERLDEALTWLFAQKSDWLDRTGMDSSILAARKAFFSSVCHAALEDGRLLLNELWVDETRVAAQLAFRVGDRLDCHMIAWEPEWRACGPGRLLCFETIRWSFANGIRIVDFGIGTHDYKYRFTDQDATAAKNVFLAPHFVGHVLLGAREALHGLRQGLRAIERYLRPSRQPSVDPVAGTS
jgi:CelD/BcsL family acetyltransferase involved in cellulose biosynthesis